MKLEKTYILLLIRHDILSQIDTMIIYFLDKETFYER